MMNTVNRLNTVVQTSNLAIQSANGSDITTTEALIAIGVGLVLGVVIFVVAKWLMDR
jgi:NhaP-type Na+/H+ or K+/H+ antiporter